MILMDRHINYFTGEFLLHPGPFWTVDWPEPPLPNPYGEVDMTGVVVRFEGYPTGDYTERRVWVLTGEFDMEMNCYKGRWPD